jgi:glucose-6-phosphate isomerase
MPDAWTRLEAEAKRLKQSRLRDLFAGDSRRFSRFSVALDDLTIDFSKEKIDAGALDALFALAREAGLEQRRDALFTGKHVNETEDRPALHMALRGGAAPPPGDDVGATRERFLAFAEAVRKATMVLKRGPSPPSSTSASAAPTSGR